MILVTAAEKITQRFMARNVKVTWITISKLMDGLTATFTARKSIWLGTIVLSQEEEEEHLMMMIPYHVPKHTRTRFGRDCIAVRILQTNLEMEYLPPVDLAKMMLTEDARSPNAKTTKMKPVQVSTVAITGLQHVHSVPWVT